MQLAQLIYFCAAAKAQNFTEAADKCFTTRQNLSHAIKALENELGIKLFQREGNGMSLTAAGSKALEAAEDICERVNCLETMFKNDSSSEQTLKIVINTNLFRVFPKAQAIVEGHLGKKRFYSEYDYATCREYVCSQKADAAIVIGMQRSFPSCEAVEIATLPTYALLSSASPLTKKSSLSVSDLLPLHILLISEITSQFSPLYEQLESLNYDLSRISVITDGEAAMKIISTTPAVGFAAGEYYAQHVPLGITAIPMSDPRLNSYIHVLYQNHRPHTGAAIQLARDLHAANCAETEY